MRGMYGENGEGSGGEKRMSRKDIFGRVRMQLKLVRTLREQLRELLKDGVRSMQMDAMPRGMSGIGRGLEIRIEKREAKEEMLRKESELLQAYEKEARREMDSMKPEHYAFCAMYYMGGLSLEETAEAMDRSVRQCARYKREIEMA